MSPRGLGEAAPLLRQARFSDYVTQRWHSPATDQGPHTHAHIRENTDDIMHGKLARGQGTQLLDDRRREEGLVLRPEHQARARTDSI